MIWSSNSCYVIFDGVDDGSHGAYESVGDCDVAVRKRGWKGRGWVVAAVVMAEEALADVCSG